MTQPADYFNAMKKTHPLYEEFMARRMCAEQKTRSILEKTVDPIIWGQMDAIVEATQNKVQTDPKTVAWKEALETFQRVKKRSAEFLSQDIASLLKYGNKSTQETFRSIARTYLSKNSADVNKALELIEQNPEIASIINLATADVVVALGDIMVLKAQRAAHLWEAALSKIEQLDRDLHA